MPSPYSKMEAYPILCLIVTTITTLFIIVSANGSNQFEKICSIVIVIHCSNQFGIIGAVKKKLGKLGLWRIENRNISCSGQ
jgi:hypothetical protein